MSTLSSWERFVSNVPESQREYRTVEIWHPQLGQVYRFVTNSLDIEAGVEEGAPRDSGKTVIFTAATLKITEPAERQDAEQVLSIDFGNVDGTIHSIIDRISGLGYFDPLDVVFRKYYSLNMTEPAVPPLYLFGATVAFAGPTAVSFNAEDVDMAQKRAGALYTTEVFPGLKD